MESLEDRRMLCTPGPDGDSNDQICEPVGTIDNGQTVTGSIGNGFGSLDVDLFELEITSSLVGKEITFTANTTDTGSNPLDTYLRLFDDDGEELEDDEDGGPGNNSKIDYKFQSAGTYYLGVSSSSNEEYNVVTGEGDETGLFSSNGAYELTFEDTNDQIDEASTTLLDGLSSGNIDLPTDVDVFEWNGADGQTVRFDLTSDDGLDTFIRIFDDVGMLLDFDDDGAPGAGTNSSLTFTFEDSGDFYVAVSSYENRNYDVEDGTGDSSTATDTGSYVITATEVNLDPDDTFATARGHGNLFFVGTREDSGEIESETDVDMYTFVVGRDGSFIEIDIDRPFAGVDSYIRLFNSDREEIASNDDLNAPGEAGAALDSFIGRELPAGTYYVGVSAYQNRNYDPVTGLGDTAGNSTGSYTIQIQDRLHVDTTDDSTGALTAEANDDRNTLREAIEFANDRDGHQEITFKNSLSGTITLSGQTLDSDQLVITDDLTITGRGPDLLSISGDDDSRVILIDDGDNGSEINVTISGVTIRDGNTTSGFAGIVPGEFGAGILNNEDLTLRNVTLTSNTTRRPAGVDEKDGGAIYHSFGTLFIEDSTLSDNSAENGGAIGVAFDSGSVTLYNSTISENFAGDTGGSIYARNAVNSDTTLAINGSMISGNSAGNEGGAIAATTTVTINASTIIGNTAGQDGGAITAGNNFATVTIDASTISGNTAVAGDGGGILIRRGNLIVQNGSTIGGDTEAEGNQAGDGGGAIIASGIVTITIDASAISGNTAGRSGGGIRMEPTGRLTVRNGSTLGGDTEAEGNKVLNDGGTGGAIAAEQAIIVIDASTISGNTTGFGGGVMIAGGSLTVQNGSTIGGDTETEGNKARDRGGAIWANSTSASDTTISSEDGTFVFSGIASVTIDDSIVSGNSANDNGGGVFLYAGSLTVQNGSTIGGDSEAEGNHADADGGAIFAQAATFAGDVIDASVTIDASTISGNTADVDGGGILMQGGTLTVQNGSTLGGDTEAEGNSATDDGGAIFAQNGTVVTIDASTVSANSAEDNGGGMFIDGATLNVLNDSTVSENTATVDGGGIHMSGGTLTVESSSIDGNQATDDGGAIYASTNASVTIDGSTISENTAGDHGGGLVMVGGTLGVKGSTLDGNHAVDDGGAIFAMAGALVTIDASTVSRNSTDDNGAGMFLTSSASGATIINSTFSGNTAVDRAGALDLAAPTVIRNSTITGNRADSDGNGSGGQGGIFATADDLTMHNTIVAGNFVGDGSSPSDLDTSDLVTGSSHNLIGSADGGSGGLADGVNGNIVGMGGVGTRDINTILDPTLANNGGSTLTHNLIFGSPAIGRGDNSQALGIDGSTSLATDQRGAGYARIKNGTVDIGAFESDFTPAAAPEVESVVIDDGTAQRSMVRDITVTFDSAVSLAAGAFTLQNTTNGTSVTPTVNLSNDKTIATLTFSGAGITGGSLSDGNYTLTIDKTKVTADAGATQMSADHTDEFFRLFGDINGDRVVGIPDFGGFRATFGSNDSNPDGYDELFDFEANGVIGISDFGQFRSRFGSRLEP